MDFMWKCTCFIRIHQKSGKCTGCHITCVSTKVPWSDAAGSKKRLLTRCLALFCSEKKKRHKSKSLHLYHLKRTKLWPWISFKTGCAALSVNHFKRRWIYAPLQDPRAESTRLPSFSTTVFLCRLFCFHLQYVAPCQQPQHFKVLTTTCLNGGAR